MRKQIVIVGVIVLVIGIVIFAAGVYGESSSSTILRTFNQQQQTGEYISNQIISNSSVSIVVRSPPSSGGLISAQDTNVVNASNINSYILPYNSTAAGNLYKGLNGNYYYVIFSSTTPNTMIVIATAITAEYGVLAIAGGVCAVAGIIIAIVGAVLKTKRKEEI